MTIQVLDRSSAGQFVTPATHDKMLKDINSNFAELLASSGPFVLVTETTTARTLSLTDARKYIRCTNASSVTVTVPPQSSVVWDADTEILVERAGAGSLTIAAGSGVTLRAPRTLVADVQYSVVTLKRVASDEWVVAGGTV